MNRDQVQGTVKDLAGKVQRKVGEMTGNTSQRIEGGAKQVEGKVQRRAGDVETAANKADDEALEWGAFSGGNNRRCSLWLRRRQKEATMRTLMKWSAAAAAVAALAGCATYPYGYSGYGYDRPYYYGYDSGPYAYGPYYYGYPSYGPYYYGAPAVGLSFGFSSGGHRHH